MRFLRLVLGRLVSTVGVLLLLSFIVYGIQRVLPTDPARALAGRTASPAQLAAAKAQLGLNDSFLHGYFRYIGQLAGGNLGISLSTRDAVGSDLRTYVPATLELVVVATLVALVLGLLLGTVGARDGRLGSTVRFLLVAAGSAPSFLVGIILLIFFYRDLGWLPGGGQSAIAHTHPTGLVLTDGILEFDPSAIRDGIEHILMPAIVLGLGPATAIGRVLRGSLREVMDADYVQSSLAKGATWRAAVRKHGLRNSLSAALSVAGLQLGVMLGGSAVVELIFSWPGIGNYLTQAIGASDLPAITGVVLVLGLAYVVINFIIDMLQLVIDPRLRDGM